MKLLEKNVQKFLFSIVLTLVLVVIVLMVVKSSPQNSTEIQPTSLSNKNEAVQADKGIKVEGIFTITGQYAATSTGVMFYVDAKSARLLPPELYLNEGPVIYFSNTQSDLKKLGLDSTQPSGTCAFTGTAKIRIGNLYATSTYNNHADLLEVISSKMDSSSAHC